MDNTIPKPLQQLISVHPAILQGKCKFVSTPDGSYNYIFNYTSGLLLRCGKTLASHDDPFYSPIGPEILDLEVSTICHGVHNRSCPFCYKLNSARGHNMSLETFKMIFDKMPTNLTQIAFGVGDIDANPDLFAMFEYCRSNARNLVIPNISINGDRLRSELISQLVKYCGAVAVSHYDDEVCFKAVRDLTESGLKQVNIHQLVAEETFTRCKTLLKQRQKDPRLGKLNAIVFLALKPQGRGSIWHPLPMEKFAHLIRYALSHHVSVGFDSCSSLKFLATVQELGKISQFETMVEPCESTLFSSYVNVDGRFYPCSFCEEKSVSSTDQGLDVFECTDFLSNVWFHPHTVEFRNKLLKTATRNSFGCRTCPIYEI